MKNLRNQKGITLVALVVTIIVLLILAGVSLSLVAGSDGILSRATKAVDENLKATVQERVNMKLAEYIEDFYEQKYVTRNIDNSTTALEFISGTIKSGDGADAKPYCSQTFKVGNTNYSFAWSAAQESKDGVDGQGLKITYTDVKTTQIYEAHVSTDGVLTEFQLLKDGKKMVGTPVYFTDVTADAS